MSEKIKIDWSLSVQIAGGPKIGVSKGIEVEAYDVVSVQLTARPAAPVSDPPPDPLPLPDADTAVPVEVQIQPGDAKQVKFLAITSDAYHPALSYQLIKDGPAIALDQMHIFMGEGAVGVLGKSLTSLIFTNNIWDNTSHKGQAVSIQIIVGRNATP